MITLISKVFVILNFLAATAMLGSAFFMSKNRLDLAELKRAAEAKRTQLDAALKRLNDGADDNKYNHLKRLRAERIDAEQRLETEKQKSEKNLKGLDQQVASANDEMEKLRVSTNQRVGELETANQEQVAQRKKSTELKQSLKDLETTIADREAKTGLEYDRTALENRLTQSIVNAHSAGLRSTQMEQRVQVLRKQLTQ